MEENNNNCVQEAEEKNKSENVHIFAWIFKYEKSKGKTAFSNQLEQLGWKTRDMILSDIPDNSEKTRDCFMLNQYLSASARNIFMNKELDICHVYEYTENELKELVYYIQKDEKEYQLPITSLELHIYKHNIGILFIQLSNWEYTEIADIKRINDYGRRTSLPYIPDKNGSVLCADKLGIINQASEMENENLITDFKAMASDYHNKQIMLQKLAQPAGFLFELLNRNLEHTKENILCIEPITDERMFTISLLRNNALSENIKLTDWSDDLKNELHTLIYVDPSDTSCKEVIMREKLLEKSIYPRWLRSGTLYGVTEYSMICITTADKGVDSCVAKPFLVEYKYFVSIVLAQRIGIGIFSDESGKMVACGNSTKTMKKSNIKKVIKLQERYINFKNQLLILEASSQIQGIEFYRLLQRQFYIEEEKTILNEQIQSLYEVANVSNGNKLQNLAIILAILAIIISVLLSVFSYQLSTLVHGILGL